ncbi:MAG: hypothetical protein IH804_08360, partial [Planctomycetes bacterium]|nr:hypothetical protein [Planctomycetota bacterium]
MPHPRIAVCSWSLRPDDESPPRLIETLAVLEIGAVQLALGPLVEARPEWAEMLPALRAAGVEVASGMMAMAGEDYTTLESIARTGGVRPDETWPANRGHAAAVARLAASEGIDLVTFHAGFLPHDRDDPRRGVMVERLRLIADLCGEHRVGRIFDVPDGDVGGAVLREFVAEEEVIAVPGRPAAVMVPDRRQGDRSEQLRGRATGHIVDVRSTPAVKVVEPVADDCGVVAAHRAVAPEEGRVGRLGVE